MKYLVFIGTAIQFFGGAVYVRETLRGRVKPNRVTFLLWAVAPLIATTAAVIDGVSWAILPTFMAGFVPLLILIASFVNKEAYWKLGAFDYVCGAFSVLTLALWLITQDAILAVLFAILADGLAGTATLVKAWHHPETETGWPYATTIIAAFLSFFAVQAWGFTEYAFSVYLIAISTAILIAIYRHQLTFKQA